MLEKFIINETCITEPLGSYEEETLSLIYCINSDLEITSVSTSYTTNKTI